MKVQPKTCAQRSLESLQTVGEVSGRHKQRDSFDALLKVLDKWSKMVFKCDISKCTNVDISLTISLILWRGLSLYGSPWLDLCQDDMSDGRPSTSTTLSGSSLDDYIANASVME